MATKTTFKTTVLQTGKNTTGIQVPDQVIERFGAGKKPAVKATINGYTYRTTIAVMGGAFMLSVSADVREKAGIKGGDKVEVACELDTEPREVDLPEDFQQLLAKHAKAKNCFDGLSNSSKKRYVLSIEGAKTEETRNRRLQKAISDLEAGIK